MSGAEANELMLAEIMGIAREAAAQRLDASVVITSADSELARLLAIEITEHLSRTVRIVTLDDTPDLEVAVGSSASGKGKKNIFVGLDNRQLIVRTSEPQFISSHPVHPFKVALAGCYAAAPILNLLLDMKLKYKPFDPFVVDFETAGLADELLERRVRLEETALAGAGAIGNGLLRALRHLKVSGSLTIVDPKTVGDSNPNRCLYFTENDIGEPKAALLAMRAQPDFKDLKLQPEKMTFNDLTVKWGRVKRVIVATDSPRVRRSIQNDLPLEVLDASTTDISEFLVHSHRYPTTGACLECIYSPSEIELQREKDIAAALDVPLDIVVRGFIDAETSQLICARYPQLNESKLVGRAFDTLFRELCAQNAIKTPSGAQVQAPFCFVSNLAGVFLALELLRFEAGIGDTNYAFYSPWAPPHSRTRRWYAKDAGCKFCHASDVKEIMEEIWLDRLS